MATMVTVEDDHDAKTEQVLKTLLHQIEQIAMVRQLWLFNAIVPAGMMVDLEEKALALAKALGIPLFRWIPKGDNNGNISTSG